MIFILGFNLKKIDNEEIFVQWNMCFSHSNCGGIEYQIDQVLNSSTLSLFSLANIDALAGGETDVSGSRTPDYSWTSDEETHWEDGCLVTTYNSHIGCLQY